MIFNDLILSSDEVLRKIQVAIEKEEQLLLTYLNQHCFNLYNRNDKYRELLDKKFSVYQADSGILLALRFLWRKKIKRIDGTSLNQIILEELIKRNEPLVLIGGNFSEEFIKAESIRRGINLMKYINGYFDQSETEEYISQLKNCYARFFFIGMGVPKQEFFALHLSQHFPNGIIICVGNFLEFYFGTKNRAPVFIRKLGLEWLFRLSTEPKRLWKRYLLGIPYFLYLIVKHKINKSWQSKIPGM